MPPRPYQRVESTAGMIDACADSLHGNPPASKGGFTGFWERAGGLWSNDIEVKAPIHDPSAAKTTYTQFCVYEITAYDESRYQRLLHDAAATRRRPETAAVNMT